MPISSRPSLLIGLQAEAVAPVSQDAAPEAAETSTSGRLKQTHLTLCLKNDDGVDVSPPEEEMKDVTDHRLEVKGLTLDSQLPENAKRPSWTEKAKLK